MTWEFSQVFESSMPLAKEASADPSAAALEQLTELERSVDALRRALQNRSGDKSPALSSAVKRIGHIAADLRATLHLHEDTDSPDSKKPDASSQASAPRRTDRYSFNKLLEAVPDIALVFSRDGIFLDFKISSPSVLITPPQYFLGKSIFDVYPPEAARKFQQNITQTFDSGEGQRWEFHAPVPLQGGELRSFEARSVPMNNAEVAVIVFNQDQNYLILNQQKAISHGLHAILSSIDELMALPLDQAFYRRAVCLAREKLGLERTALYFLEPDDRVRGTVGMDFDGQLVDESASALPLAAHPIHALLHKAHPHARWIEGEVPLYAWTGQKYQPSQRGSAAVTYLSKTGDRQGFFYNDDGLTGRGLDPIRQELLVVYASLLGTLLERKRAEQALAESEARYRLLYAESEAALTRTRALYDASRSIIGSAGLEDVLHSLADSVVRALDADQVQVLIIDSEQQKIIQAVEDTINPNPRLHAPISYAEACAGLCGVVLRTDQPVQSLPDSPDLRESPIARINRQLYLGKCTVAVAPLRFQNRVIGTIKVVNRHPKPPQNESDLELLVALAGQTAVAIENARLQTETEHRAAVLAQQAEELARSNRDLEQFAYVASHDLQEPLRTASGFIQLFLHRYGDGLTGESRLLLEQSLEAAGRMRTLILDLLVYSRVGTQPQRQAPVAVGKILEQVQESLAPLITENDATILWGEMPLVQGDEIQLQQLFQNLISNSIKFRTDSPPQIRISAHRSHDRWLFSVQDNGIGIAPEQFQRIFMVFQRLHTREEYPGTGIGLAICKRIVERQKGRIWLESAPGEGTTFFFTLPGAEAAE